MQEVGVVLPDERFFGSNTDELVQGTMALLRRPGETAPRQTQNKGGFLATVLTWVRKGGVEVQSDAPAPTGPGHGATGQVDQRKRREPQVVPTVVVGGQRCLCRGRVRFLPGVVGRLTKDTPTLADGEAPVPSPVASSRDPSLGRSTRPERVRD